MGARRLALEGVRIIDAGTVQAGPWASRPLADMGAEVIRVESRIHLEVSRMYSYPDNSPGRRFWEQGAIYHEQHRNKRCLTLELNLPQGVAVFEELVKISDVVIDSRPPRVMRNFGLGYSNLREINPQIILLSSIGYGHGGPYSDFWSYGMPAEAMSGISGYTGYEGGPPRRGTIPYPDHISALHGCFAILAALEYRRHSGKGQWIDLAHYEVAIQTTGQALMDYFFNQRVYPRMGNHHPLMCPHGTYRCAGMDHWVVIAVATDEQWRGLCHAMGDPLWCQEDRFATAQERKRHEEEVDRLIEKWTVQYDADDVFHRLQKEKVPAGPVLSNKAQLLDPHFRERGFWEWVPHHPEQENVGTRPYPGAMWKMSKTPGGIRRPAPLLGEDNTYLLKHVLGKSDEDIADLALIGVLGNEPEAKDAPPPARPSPQVLLKAGRILEWDPDYKEILGIDVAKTKTD